MTRPLVSASSKRKWYRKRKEKEREMQFSESDDSSSNGKSGKKNGVGNVRCFFKKYKELGTIFINVHAVISNSLSPLLFMFIRRCRSSRRRNVATVPQKSPPIGSVADCLGFRFQHSGIPTYSHR